MMARTSPQHARGGGPRLAKKRQYHQGRVAAWRAGERKGRWLGSFPEMTLRTVVAVMVVRLPPRKGCRAVGGERRGELSSVPKVGKV